jgi:hypothetical protein
VKGESAIWNVLMSAAGASFLIVAVALMIVAARSSDPTAGDAPDATEIGLADSGSPDTGPETGSASTVPVEVAVIESAAGVDAFAPASPDASAAAESAGDAGPSEHDDEADAGAVAAASAQPQPPVKSPSTKTKPTKRKTKKPR